MDIYNISGMSANEIDSQTEEGHYTSLANTEQELNRLETFNVDPSDSEDKIEVNPATLEDRKKLDDQYIQNLEERWNKSDRERLDTINQQNEEIKKLNKKLTDLQERCIEVENEVKRHLRKGEERNEIKSGADIASFEVRLSALEAALGKAVNYMFPRMDEILSRIEESSDSTLNSFASYPRSPSNSISSAYTAAVLNGGNPTLGGDSKDNTMHNATSAPASPTQADSSSAVTVQPRASKTTPTRHSDPNINFQNNSKQNLTQDSSSSRSVSTTSSLSSTSTPKSSISSSASILLDPTLLTSAKENAERIYPILPSNTSLQRPVSPVVSFEFSNSSKLHETDIQAEERDENEQEVDEEMYPFSIPSAYLQSSSLTPSHPPLSTTSPSPPVPPSKTLPNDLDNALRDVAKEGNADEVCRLLLAGADADAGDNLWTTALHWAAIKGHQQVVSALLEGDASIDCRDVSGWTPLHFAASKGHAGVVSFLLRRGASTRAVDDKQWTPLHVAVHGGHVDCVRLLLASGADAFAADILGKKMLDLTDSEAVRELLRRAMH